MATTDWQSSTEIHGVTSDQGLLAEAFADDCSHPDAVHSLITNLIHDVLPEMSAEQFQTAECDGSYVCHVLRSSKGFVGVALADREYPAPTVESILRKLTDDYAKDETTSWALVASDGSTGLEWPPLTAALSDYQDPERADQLIQIQSCLDDIQRHFEQMNHCCWFESGDMGSRAEELRVEAERFRKMPRSSSPQCSAM